MFDHKPTGRVMSSYRGGDHSFVAVVDQRLGNQEQPHVLYQEWFPTEEQASAALHHELIVRTQLLQGFQVFWTMNGAQEIAALQSLTMDVGSRGVPFSVSAEPYSAIVYEHFPTAPNSSGEPMRWMVRIFEGSLEHEGSEILAQLVPDWLTARALVSWVMEREQVRG